MFYGIQARQSVRLTEIGRALQEPISLEKTEYRLCRQLRRQGLWERLTKMLCRMAAARIQNLTLLILDLSDISKKCARKMEYLARVHDGSEDGLGTGYWLLQIIGAESGKHMVLPLYNRLYSQRSPDHQSENIEILTAIETVNHYTQGKGVWMMDQGMVSEDNLAVLRERGAWHIVGTPRTMLKRCERNLLTGSWDKVQPGVEVKKVFLPHECEEREAERFILCRSRDRVGKEAGHEPKWIGHHQD